jgi:hypothetical protein
MNSFGEMWVFLYFGRHRRPLGWRGRMRNIRCGSPASERPLEKLAM